MKNNNKNESITILSDISNKIDSFLTENNISAYEVFKKTGISQASIGRYRKGTSKPTSTNLEKIFKVYPDLEKRILGKSKPTPEEEYQLPKSELKPKTYEGSIKVRLVTNTAKAGWSDGYYADEYLKDMPVVIVEADENYKGSYMAFEVEGDSMEPDYIEGNIVICREVQRHLWQSKLHYRDWDFVIAHAKDGIYLKEIINHDVEKGIITCHSLNPNYKDFKIDLREVAHLYNVVETRQQGRNKRWNRAKDFFKTEE